jgi:CheY-like chemotaxis protein
MALILVVDDDDIARRVVGGTLQSGGYEVAYASDGDTALELYRRQSFAAVVLDMVMPMKSGLETLRELLDIDADARVIAISGASDGDLVLAKKNGAVATLRKPTGVRDLLSVVQAALTSPGGA